MPFPAGFKMLFGNALRVVLQRVPTIRMTFGVCITSLPVFDTIFRKLLTISFIVFWLHFTAGMDNDLHFREQAWADASVFFLVCLHLTSKGRCEKD